MLTQRHLRRSGLALLLALTASSCALPRIRASARLGQLDLDGSIGASSSGSAIQSSASALGLDKDKAVPEARVDLDWLGVHVGLSQFGSRHEGRGTAQTTLSLGGGPSITAGTPVDSMLEVELTTARVTWDVIPTRFADIGIGFGVGYYDYEVDVRSLATISRVRSDESFPIAFLALRAASQIGPFEAVGNVGALDVDLGSDELSYYDVDLSVGYRFFKKLKAQGQVTLGYRMLMTDLKYSDRGGEVEADLEFSGPYLGLTFSI